MAETTLKRKYHEGSSQFPVLSSQKAAAPSQSENWELPWSTGTNECKHRRTNHFGCRLMRCYNPTFLYFLCATAAGTLGWLAFARDGASPGSMNHGRLSRRRGERFYGGFLWR